MLKKKLPSPTFFYDSADYSLLRKNNWLKQRIISDDDTKGKWSLKKQLKNEEDGISYISYQGIDEVIEVEGVSSEQELKKKYSTLLAILDIRRYTVSIGSTDNATVYVEEVQLGQDDYFLVGTLESKKREEIIAVLEKLQEMGIKQQASRSKIVEYLYSYEPDLYDELIKSTAVKDIPYVCSLSFNRPTKPADSKPLNEFIHISDLHKHWHLLDNHDCDNISYGGK